MVQLVELLRLTIVPITITHRVLNVVFLLGMWIDLLVQLLKLTIIVIVFVVSVLAMQLHFMVVKRLNRNRQILFYQGSLG